MFIKEIVKILFIISYLKKIILNWMQSRIKNYFNNKKNEWESKTFQIFFKFKNFKIIINQIFKF